MLTGESPALPRTGDETLPPSTQPMRVVIPFVAGGLAPETRALGEQVNAEFVDVGGSDTAYFELVRRLWAREGFLLVEQDVVPPVAIIEEMSACERDWCCGPYPQLQMLKSREGEPRGRLRLVLDIGLGATRFSDDLLRREADAMERAWAISTRHWSVLDLVLMREVLMKERGHLPHIHVGHEVRHLRVEAAYFPLEPRLDYHHRHWARSR